MPSEYVSLKGRRVSPIGVKSLTLPGDYGGLSGNRRLTRAHVNPSTVGKSFKPTFTIPADGVTI